MRAGQLRHRITIEANGQTRNEYGELVEDWSPLATVWASKEDLSGREQFQGQQFNAVVTTKFAIRYRDDVTAAMRILLGSTVYNIESIQDPTGRKETLFLLCSHGA